MKSPAGASRREKVKRLALGPETWFTIKQGSSRAAEIDPPGTAIEAIANMSRDDASIEAISLDAVGNRSSPRASPELLSGKQIASRC
jgi:hypothetical protein